MENIVTSPQGEELGGCFTRMLLEKRIKVVSQDIAKLEQLLSLREKVVDDTFVGRSLLPSEILLHERLQKLKAKHEKLQEELKRKIEEDLKLTNLDFAVLNKFKARARQNRNLTQNNENGAAEKKNSDPPGFVISFRLSKAYNAILSQEKQIDSMNVGRTFGPKCKFGPSRKLLQQSPENIGLPCIDQQLNNAKNRKGVTKEKHRIRLPLIKSSAKSKECSFFLSKMSSISLDRSSTLQTFAFEDDNDIYSSPCSSQCSCAYFTFDDKTCSSSDSGKATSSCILMKTNKDVLSEASGPEKEDSDYRYIYKLKNCTSLNDPAVLLRPPFTKTKQKMVGMIEILDLHPRSLNTLDEMKCKYCEQSHEGHVMRWLHASATGVSSGIYGPVPRRRKTKKGRDLERTITTAWAAGEAVKEE